MDQESGFLQQLAAVLHSQGLVGVMAFVLSLVKFHYEKESRGWKHKIIDALFAGLIAVVVGKTVAEFGLSQGWSFLFAGIIGTLGVEFVRDIAKKYLTKKTEE